MHAFVVIKKVRKAGAKPTRIAHEKLRIGRGGENDVDLDDFLVSPVHCEIEWIGGQFRLSDAGSVTGTFVDGRPIEKYFTLTGGQKITVGLNRLEIAVDLAKQECTVTIVENIGTGEKTLHKVAFLRGRPWFLRPKNHLLAGFGVALLPVLVGLALGRPSIFMNGGLARAHAVDARTGKAQDCGACHTAGRGAPAAKCAACHEAAVGPASTHPLAAQAVANLGCVECHFEHKGEAAKIVPAAIPPAGCRSCHAGAHRGTRPGAGGRGREVLVKLDGFDHGAHARAGLADCATCHKPTAAPKGSSRGAGDDFVRMGYEGCVACHAHRSQAVEAHGTNAQCAACHAGPNEKALALVSEPVAARVAAKFAPQHHDLGQRCEQCHAGAARDLESRSTGKPFDHYAHLASLAPAAGEAAGRVEAQCALCHADARAAATVEASHPAPAASVCATCHTSVELGAGAAAAGPEKRTTVRFSHAAHAKTGCLACHSFEKDAPGAAPRVAGAPADCAACHMKPAAEPGKRAHVDAGLDACVYCHRGASDVFEPRPAARLETPSIPYSHRSPTHATLACDECHQDARAAATVTALRFPSFDAQACQRCHGATQGGDLDCVRCHSFHHDALVKGK